MNYVMNKHQIGIIDDQPDTRNALADTIADSDSITPHVYDDKFESLEVCIKTVHSQDTAAIFDNHLSQRNYANFRGILAVSRLYLLFFPALLVSSYEADVLEMREYRQHVPIILAPDKVTPDSIIKGLEICKNEFAEKFTSERKPWRSLVRVDEISEDKKSVYVVIPSWNEHKPIKLLTSMLPPEYLLHLAVDVHFFAQVNVDTEHHQDLYLHSFEPIKKLRAKYAKFIHS